MFRRVEHVVAVVATLVVLIAFAISRYQHISLSKLSQPLALIPASVGNRAAPVPILEIDRSTLSDDKPVTLNQVRRAITSAVGGRGVIPKYPLREYTLSWLVSVEDGSLAPMQAVVFVPKGEDSERFPVIVYGAGSTGLADRCAPSREDLRRGNMGNYRNYVISQASQGYVVAMPNYEGFDNPDRSQHYFNKDSEARSLLSTARALLVAAPQKDLPVKDNALFFGGYSQGGHAVFSAADYASTFAPDLKISGVYAHGPTTDVVELLKNNPNLAAYFVASYSDYYPAIKPAEILEPEWIGYLDRARQICVNEGFGTNSTSVEAVFAADFEAALMQGTLPFTFPEVQAVFEENNAGTSFTSIPAMIVQGTADPIVTVQDQNAFVSELCQRRVPVDLKPYVGVHHFDTRRVSFKDTNAWIDTIVSGQTPTDVCPDMPEVPHSSN